MTKQELFKQFIEQLFAGCPYIKLVKFDCDSSGFKHSVEVNVNVDLTDEDFDTEFFEADEDYAAHSETIFTSRNIGPRAVASLFAYFVNEKNLKFSYFDSQFHTYVWSFEGYLHSEPQLHIKFDNRCCFFGYDEPIYDKEPTIEVHSSRMIVRGVMDADPPEYDYETSPSSLDVPVFFEVWY